MPRSKKAAWRGRGKGAHSGHGRRMLGPATSFVPFAGISTRPEDEGYSLQSEALNTQRHKSSWDSDQRLRDTKVMFVSAADSKGSEVTEPETGLAHMTLNETSKELQGDESDTRRDIQLDQDGSVIGRDDRLSGTVEKVESSFIIDTQGSVPVVTGLPPPKIRPISPTPSSSSDEVIVFAGRDKAGKGLSKLPKNINKSTDPYDSRIRMIEDKIHENQILLAMNAKEAMQTSLAQPAAVDNPPRLQRDKMQETLTRTCLQPATHMPEAEITGEPSYRRSRSQHGWKMKQEQEQALIDDYVANMAAQEMDPGLSFNQRDLGGTDTDCWQETEMSSADAPKLPSLNEWGRLELGDFDVMSTSGELFGSVQAILSKRNRKNGQQYLVVWEHQSVDEARWVPSSSLTDVNSMKLIAKFEDEEKLTAEVFGEEDSDTDSDNDNDPACDKDDDADLLQRKIDRMTDEKIAKLLAKQEELGMGSSEVMLFDDSPEADLDEGDTKNHHTLKPTRHALRKLHNVSRAKGDFPAASALADAYDGFDVMDFERPSLKKKAKGRKGRLAFDLSDSELEASMVMAWDKDRLRKRERKEERKALRVQGLLGKKETKPDLKAKYKEGMGIHAVKDEIKHFLMGDNTTLALPPMDKADRKLVHELANAFNLKSKSAGNGNKRFPVLYRTQRTSSFSETSFAAVESRLTRRYLPRMDLRGRNSVSVPKRSGQGGVNNGAVSYRDGDIVGGSAPELGIENKGRAMLEKMGWSTGTALGALNNKGILQPVSHVVKTTKAGLG